MQPSPLCVARPAARPIAWPALVPWPALSGYRSYLLSPLPHPPPTGALTWTRREGGGFRRKGGRVAHAPPRPPPPNCTCCVCVRVGACVALRVCVCGTACMHARVPSFTPSTLSHPPAHASKRAKRPIAAAGLQYLSWCLSSRGMDRFEHFRPGLQIGVHFASQLFEQIVQSPPPPPRPLSFSHFRFVPLPGQ